MHAPIYLGVKGNVYDVSYGGADFYGPGKSYNLFAGRDASRSLAKVSLEAADAESRDLSDLTEEQLKTLDDWEAKISKKYPIVGTMAK